jgi:hypothetical protein
MSALMDQVYESEAASPPASAVPPPSPKLPTPVRRLEAPLVIVVSVAVAGAVFGFAMSRFGWAGMLIATWPALALAAGCGCLCQDAFRRFFVADREPRAN